MFISLNDLAAFIHDRMPPRSGRAYALESAGPVASAGFVGRRIGPGSGAIPATPVTPFKGADRRGSGGALA